MGGWEPCELSVKWEMPYNAHGENELITFLPFYFEPRAPFALPVLCCWGDTGAGTASSWAEAGGGTGAGRMSCPNPPGAAQGLWNLSQAAVGPSCSEMGKALGLGVSRGCQAPSPPQASSVLLASLPTRDFGPPGGRESLGKGRRLNVEDTRPPEKGVGVHREKQGCPSRGFSG